MSKVKVTMLHGTQSWYKSHNRLGWKYKSSYLGSRWQCERVMGQTLGGSFIATPLLCFICFEVILVAATYRRASLTLSTGAHDPHNKRAPTFPSSMMSGYIRENMYQTAFNIISAYLYLSATYLHITSQWLFTGIEEQRVNADEGWCFFFY